MVMESHLSYPFVSVIVPVYNDEQRIGKCIEALLDQTYPKDRHEILVVDNGSSDGTRAIVRRFAVNALAEDTIKSSYAARNMGIRNSQGEIIAFTDSDCIPNKDWLEKGVIDLLKVPGCGLVAGRINIFFGITNRPNAVEIYDSVTNFKQKDDLELRKFGSTANVFTYRSVLDRVGLFDDNLKSGGDNDWGRRVYSAGYKQVYSDEAIVRHPARNSFKQLRMRTRRLSGGCYEQYIRDSFIAYVKDVVQSAKNVAMMGVRILIGRWPADQLSGHKMKLQFISVYTFIQVVRIMEMTRLLVGARPYNDKA